jgi:hypothetical protein
MIPRAGDTRRADFAPSPAKAIEPPLRDATPTAARVSPTIRWPALYDIRRNTSRSGPRRALLTAIAFGTGILLSGCAVAHDYDAAAVYDDDDHSSNTFGFSSWGWRNCDCGTFGQMDRTEPEG